MLKMLERERDAIGNFLVWIENDCSNVGTYQVVWQLNIIGVFTSFLFFLNINVFTSDR